MTVTPAKPSPTPEGALEFELIDLSEARIALEEPPDGLEIASSLQPKKWDSKRRPKLATDRALVGRTMDWILSLPPDARPVKLADEAPRLANALAELWPDADRATTYIDELLIDRRGGRRGLAPALKEELVLLRRITTAEREKRASSVPPR